MAREDNLVHWKKGQSGNPNGRPKNVGKTIDGLNPEDKKETLEILLHCIKLNDTEEMTQYIESSEMFGVMKRITLKALSGKNAWQALNDILDRLFGRARQTAEVTHKGGTQIIVNAPDKDTAEKLGEL